jgi:hypothetical protein
MMFPSVSLNHAALASPAVEIPFSSILGMSYFSTSLRVSLGPQPRVQNP